MASCESGGAADETRGPVCSHGQVDTGGEGAAADVAGDGEGGAEDGASHDGCSALELAVDREGAAASEAGCRACAAAAGKNLSHCSFFGLVAVFEFLLCNMSRFCCWL